MQKKTKISRSNYYGPHDSFHSLLIRCSWSHHNEYDLTYHLAHWHLKALLSLYALVRFPQVSASSRCEKRIQNGFSPSHIKLFSVSVCFGVAILAILCIIAVATFVVNLHVQYLWCLSFLWSMSQIDDWKFWKTCDKHLRGPNLIPKWAKRKTITLLS